MRAATPKADIPLRQADPGQGPGTARTTEIRHGPIAAELEQDAPLGASGITRFRTTLQEASWPPTAANDATRSRPAPLSPLLVSSLVMLLDLVAILGAGMAADALTGALGARHAAPTLLLAGLTVAGGLWTQAYDHAALFSAERQMQRIGKAAVAALLATLAGASAFDGWRQLDPAWLAAAVPLGALSLLGGRAAVTGLLRHELGTRAARRAVIIGAGSQAQRLISALNRDPAGLDILGLVDDRAARNGTLSDGIPTLGGLSTLFGMIRRGEVDVVILALPWAAEARIAELIERLSAYPVEVRIAPDLVASRLPKRHFPTGPILLRACPISGFAGLMKRIEDYALALLALAIAAVPMLLIAIAVKLDSRGPVLFRQKRIGFNDQPFYVLKFRTMYAEATDHDVQRQVLAGDPRVTRVGAILRRTSLDELPQIFNVLRGEMSFVGPRPHAPGTRAGNRRFDEVVANYAARHCVKPGLTGLAQVRGWRGPTLNEEQILKRVESDLEYIERWSLWLDFLIILRTLLAVVRMRNAL